MYIFGKWTGLDQSDPIIRLIPLSGIPLTGVHCITKSWIKLSIIYFDSNNQTLIPLSSIFYQHFDQMNGT
jgi:hypothetical protein